MLTRFATDLRLGDYNLTGTCILSVGDFVVHQADGTHHLDINNQNSKAMLNYIIYIISYTNVSQYSLSDSDS